MPCESAGTIPLLIGREQVTSSFGQMSTPTLVTGTMLIRSRNGRVTLAVAACGVSITT